MICRICWVSGQVQGVFYRGSAQAGARALGSPVCPEPRRWQGRAPACGDSSQVDAFIGWLWIGPAAASVSGVEIAERDPAGCRSGFTIA